MCGIAGFSLKQNSSVNARVLAHALLSQIESRGSHASGFAFTSGTALGYYKNAVRGGQLPLRTMPRDAKTVILHTRFSTHGSETDNRNNHPVMSPDGNIALTHNGVISNHDTVRRGFSPQIQAALPEVDTSVIPTLLQEGSYRDFNKLGGYAAVAWLVKGEENLLHLGRLKNSPVAWTQLQDGSFVYASTKQLLQGALRQAGLWHGGILELAEHDYIIVNHGLIVASATLPNMSYQSSSAYSGYQSATSGQGPRVVTPAKAAGSANPGLPKSATPTFSGSENDASPKGIGSSFGKRAWEEDDEDDANALDAALAMMKLRDEGKSYEELDDEYWDEVEGFDMPGRTRQNDRPAVLDGTDDEDYEPNFGGNEIFYTIDMWGNMKGYSTLDAFETDLKWHAGLREGEDFFGADGLARWVEHFVDIGEVDKDGKLVSFVDNRENVAAFQQESNSGLEYILEGIAKISPSRGM